jgi:hypothetical protein
MIKLGIKGIMHCIDEVSDFVPRLDRTFFAVGLEKY